MGNIYLKMRLTYNIYLELRKKANKKGFTPHFTISFAFCLLELWRSLFPLDFHQLIPGDSADDFRRRLDQVGAKP